MLSAHAMVLRLAYTIQSKTMLIMKYGIKQYYGKKEMYLLVTVYGDLDLQSVGHDTQKQKFLTITNKIYGVYNSFIHTVFFRKP